MPDFAEPAIKHARSSKAGTGKDEGTDTLSIKSARPRCPTQNAARFLHFGAGSVEEAAFSATRNGWRSRRPYNVSITEAARQFAEARRILGDDSLLQAAEFFAKHRAQERRRGALQSVTLPDLVKKYLEAVEGK